MKIRNSSRVLAIVLAMMMIVPMIGIPTFAEGPTPLYKQDFETGTLTDLIKTSNPSVSIKDLGEDDAHGNVFYFDMNKGPTDDGNLYLIKDKDASQRHKVTSYTENADGTVNGKVVVTLKGAEPVELMFENAVVETQKLTPNENGGLLNAVQLYTIKLVEDGIDEETWEVKYREEKDQPWNNFVGAIVDCKTANAIQGGGNIATHSYLKSPALTATGSVVTYSMDYNVNHDWNITTELHAMKGTFRFVRFERDGNNLVVHPHSNLTIKDGTPVQVATDNWFNLTIVADYATATIEVYINGNFAFNTNPDGNIEKIEAKVVEGNVTVDADSLQLIQVNRSAGETRFYDGDLMVDNVAIYNGKVIGEAAEILQYTFSSNFNGTSLPIDFGTGAEVTTFPEDSNSMKVDLDTYDEETGEDLEAVKAIDKNLFISSLPAFEPVEGVEDYYFEADYFIPEGAVFKLQGQFYSVTADQGSYTWVSIYTIKANGSNVVFEHQGEGAKTNNTQVYYTDLPMGEWFTMTHRINLKTGMMYHYVNGVEYAHWQLCRDGADLTNVKIAAGTRGWIICKPNKPWGSGWKNSTTPGLTSYALGHCDQYPNGYSGFLMLDNFEIYTQKNLLTIKEREVVDTTYWTEDYSKKLINQHAYAYSTHGPLTATYTDAIDGNMAVRFDMYPPNELLKAVNLEDDFIAAVGRSYWMTGIDDNPDFDPTADITTLLPLLKLTHTTWWGGYGDDDHQVYIARKGNIAYVYGVDGHGVSGPVTDPTSLSLIGEYTIISKDAEGAKALYDCMSGAGNSNTPFTVSPGTYAYDDTDGANNTYVLSADYYVPTGTKGKMESQIVQGGYYLLYQMDFTNGTIGENSKIIYDAWNKVDTIMTITAAGVYNFDIYVNGVFDHSVVHEIGTAIMPGAWSVAKIMNNQSTTDLNAGSFYLDNVSVKALDSAKLQTVEVPVGVISATVDGVKVALTAYGETKFYATEVELGAFDLQGAFAGVITTEKAASIRIDEPTGLRFASKVDEAMIAQLKELGYTVSFGTLIAPRDLVKGNELVHGLMDPLVDVKNVGKYYDFDNNAATNHIVGSIVEIKEGNLDRDFTARGYIKVEKDGNVEYIYSATTHSVSVADQAKATIDGGLIAEGDAGYDVVAAFAAKAA